MGFLAVGILIGALMGLSGVGGGIVAVPIFYHAMGIPLKEATLFSLYTVLLATGLNWFSQRNHTDIKTALTCAFFGMISSRIAAPVKSVIPDTGIKAIFALLCVTAIFLTWRNHGRIKTDRVKDAPLASFLKKGLFGSLVGTLATFVGVGGGVLLIPLLTHFLGFSAQQAVSTSLLTLHFTAWASLVAQLGPVRETWDSANIGFLALGCLFSALVVRVLIQRIPARQLQKIRYTLYLSVIGVALVSMFF